MNISTFLKVAPRYVRSFEIERDLVDPAAMEGYILTPAVLFASQTLSGGLRRDSTQRAWRITGPYGAGKSAYGLFLGHLAARSSVGKRLLSHVKSNASALYKAWEKVPRYLPIAITGTRTSFGTTLVGRLRRAVETLSTRRPPTLLADLRRLEAIARLSENQVTDALSKFVEYALSAKASQGKYEGVLLLVDEMGKFLEHAALRPDEADPYLFQRVAEMAAGGSKHPLAVVGFLHQNFADYAIGYGERAQEEWSKVAQRFEDIPFDEPLEQYGFLLANAMQYDSSVLRTSGIDQRAVELYRGMVPKGPEFDGRQAALLEVSPRLYPIHPSTFVAISSAVKRFGQNQRSLFSFLLAGEAHGLQRFVTTTPLHPDNWYRLPHLYDYLATLDGISFKQGDRARKWELLRDTLAHGPNLDSFDREVLKTVGLLNVLDPVPHLISDAKGVSFALRDTTDSAEVNGALKRLVDQNLLFLRRAQGDYCIWGHSSVDLQAAYEEAAKATRALASLDDLFASIGHGRPLIAHRHFQRTGTLRAFRVRFASLSQTLGLAADEAIADYDGEVLVILADPSCDLNDAARRIGQHTISQNRSRIIVIRKIDPSDLGLANETRIWERIRQTCVELRVDEYARREVDQRLDNLRRQLEERISSLTSFSYASGNIEAAWIYRGRRIDIETSKALSKRLSGICDEVYNAAPIIRNELINRHKLSSAISLARQRLIARMLEKAEEKGLALSGTPPERSIYLSVFEASGIHRKEKSTIGFYPPRRNSDDQQWVSVWEGLREYLSAAGKVSFGEVFQFLRNPPYGMRQGPAMLLIMAFILHERRRIALFDRNTYIVDFTENHVQRLVKVPAQFTIHLQPQLGGMDGLFQTYADAVISIKGEVVNLVDPHGIVSVLYRWFSGLSEYTQQTSRLSAQSKEVRTTLNRAMDPIDLLTKALPNVCGFPNVGESPHANRQMSEFSASLKEALFEIDNADTGVRNHVFFTLKEAFEFEGNVSELRAYLQRSFGPYAAVLGDHKLKATLTRLVDSSLADIAWLESIAAVLSERSISIWKDETIEKFRTETQVFSGQLKRWVALMKSVSAKGANTGLFSVHVTAASGKEHTLLVSHEKQSPLPGANLKQQLRKILTQNPEQAPLALAELLTELLSKAGTTGREGDAKN